MVPDVLRTKEHTVRQRLQKHSRCDETGYWLQTKTTDSLHPRAHFAQLRNAIRGKGEPFQGAEIFSAGMLLVGRLERLPDGLPDTIFGLGVRGIGDRLSRFIAQSQPRDLIPAFAIFPVAKTRMVGIELDDGVAVRPGFSSRDQAHIDMIDQWLLLCLQF